MYTWDDNTLVACKVVSHHLRGLFAEDDYTKQPKVSLNRMRTWWRAGFSESLEAIEIKLRYMEFDGQYLGWREMSVQTSPFEGEREISSLPAFPASFWPDGKARERMISRGKLYYSLTTRTHCQYHGETLSSPMRTVHSRVVIESWV